MTEENKTPEINQCLDLVREIVRTYEPLVLFKQGGRTPTREEELAYWGARNLLEAHACLDATKNGAGLGDIAKLLESAEDSHLRRAEVYWEILHYAHEDAYHRALQERVPADQLAELYRKVTLSHTKMEKLEKRLHGTHANSYGHVGQPPTKTSEHQ